MKKCPLCDFTVDTGDFYQDEMDLSRHYMNHSDKEKKDYFDLMHPQSEREKSFKDYRGWQNRINRLETDILALGETVLMMDDKMSVEERVSFKTNLDELFKYWERFKQIYDAFRSSALYEKG